jgi:hypothetical protein
VAGGTHHLILMEEDGSTDGMLEKRLKRIESLDDEIRRKASKILGKGEAMYSSDLFLLGALRRTFAQCRGFCDLIRSKNFPCAAAILRLQIDTAMRVNGLRFVENIEDFCHTLTFGEKNFSQMKDRAGVKLTDAYLRQKLSQDHDWISSVYVHTSDLIHLSGKHLMVSIVDLDDESRTVRFNVSSYDPPRPDEEYFEVVDAFFEATKLAGILILGCLASRHMPEPTP